MPILDFLKKKTTEVEETAGQPKEEEPKKPPKGLIQPKRPPLETRSPHVNEYIRRRNKAVEEED